MRKIIFLISLMLVGQSIFCQYTNSNLVVNGDFESANNPDCSFGNTGACCTGNTPFGYSDIKDYWDNFPNWTYPEATTNCIIGALFGQPVGTADELCYSMCSCNIHPHSGNRFGRIITGQIKHESYAYEYLINSLSQSLNDNHIYYVEYYIAAQSSNYSYLGLRFFQDRPKQCISIYSGKNDKILQAQNGKSHTARNSDIIVPNGLSQSEWRKVSAYFKPPSNNLNFIGIGEYDADYANNHEGTFYIDDVKIIDLGTNACPQYWLFQNTEFTDNRIYQASDYIKVGKNVDPNEPQGDVAFKAGSRTILRAANSVSLLPGTTMEPGFTTKPGAYFHAYIQPFHCSATGSSGQYQRGSAPDSNAYGMDGAMPPGENHFKPVASTEDEGFTGQPTFTKATLDSLKTAGIINETQYKEALSKL